MNIDDTLMNRDDFLFHFFSGKVLKLVQAHLFFSRFRYKIRSFLLLNGEQTPLTNCESIQVTKNVIDFKFEVLPKHPVFFQIGLILSKNVNQIEI